MNAPLPVVDGRGLHDDELELGHLLGAFGVRGEVRVFLHHRESTLLARGRDVVLVAPDGTRYAARLRTRVGGRRVVGTVDGVTDRDVADALRDHVVAVPRSVLPRLGPGEFYDWQVVGAAVRIDGVDVGRIAAVDHTPGGDVLVVDDARGRHFVPCVRAWVLDLDLHGGVVTLATGALDGDDA